MQCYVCGKDIGSGIGMCEQCKNERNARRDSPRSPSAIAASYVDSNEGAGFWVRLLAYLIDGYTISIGWGLISLLILTPLLSLSVMTLFSGWANRLSIAIFSTDHISLPAIIISTVFAILITFAITSIFIGFLYFALFESSSLMATPGKWLVGLKVSDLKNNRLTLGSAFLRSLAKIISWIPFGLGFVLIGVTEEKRGLHDLVARTRVFKGAEYTGSRILLAIVLAVVLMFINNFVSPSAKSKSTSFQSSSDETLSPVEAALK